MSCEAARYPWSPGTETAPAAQHRVVVSGKSIFLARHVRFGSPNTPVPTESTLLSNEEAITERESARPVEAAVAQLLPTGKKAPPPVHRHRRQTASDAKIHPSRQQNATPPESSHPMVRPRRRVADLR